MSFGAILGCIAAGIAYVLAVLVRSDRQWRKAMDKLAAYQKERQAILDKAKQDNRTDEEVLRGQARPAPKGTKKY